MWILALSLISCCEHILLLLSSLGNASAQTFRPLLHLRVENWMEIWVYWQHFRYHHHFYFVKTSPPRAFTHHSRHTYFSFSALGYIYCLSI